MWGGRHTKRLFSHSLCAEKQSKIEYCSAVNGYGLRDERKRRGYWDRIKNQRSLLETIAQKLGIKQVGISHQGNNHLKSNSNSPQIGTGLPVPK